MYKLNISITKQQEQFISANAFEVLFGGAAGGGKSYGQLIDAFLFALKYPKSKQLILRRTFPELEKSLIRTSLAVYPQDIYKYNSSKHIGTFCNGSIIDFGYCDAENDVFKYQSAEYDVIRFDEATHFTEDMYIYLISRVRGANNFPKQVKASTNPGGVGHEFFKKRFIAPHAPNEEWESGTGTRIFIPSKVTDNKFLLDSDPDYIKRLENLNDKDKRALLYGDWDIFDGQYFSEFNRNIHACKPFPIPFNWKRYVTLDYGMDMLAVLWIAVDEQGHAYAYRELYEGKDNSMGANGQGHIVSEAVRRIKEANGDDDVYQYLAPPDLWNRNRDTGMSTENIFNNNGISLVKTSNNRVNGWRAVREQLKVTEGEQGEHTSNIKIFDNCVNLIRCLPAVQYDGKNAEDVATQPHEITHIVDALRGFCVYWVTKSNVLQEEQDFINKYFKIEDKTNATGEGGTRFVI